MTGTIRARVKEELIEPLDHVDLPEGQEIVVTILTAPTAPDREAFQRRAGQWKGTLDAEAWIGKVRELATLTQNK